MSKIKINVSNKSSKTVQFHYLSSQGTLNSGATNEISINIGDTLYFENDNSIKYKITDADAGKTFTYNR